MAGLFPQPSPAPHPILSPPPLKKKSLFLLFLGVQTQTIGLGVPSPAPTWPCLASLGPGQSVLQFPPGGKTSSHITCAAAATRVDASEAPGPPSLASTGWHDCTSEFANLDKDQKKGQHLSWGSRVGEWAGAAADPGQGTGRQVMRSVLSKENLKTIKPTKSVCFMLSLCKGHSKRQ